MPDMNEWLQTVFNPTDGNAPLSALELFFRLLMAAGLGIIVACIYRATHRGDDPATPSFIATLVLLSVLLAMVPQVIGNSAARAFSLVGILAIVRFRTTVEDTRDTAFVIVAVIVGMAAGVGNILVAIVGLAVVGTAALLLCYVPLAFSKPQVAWSLQLRVSTGAGAQMPWEDVFARHCGHSHLISTATAKQGAALDLTYMLSLNADVTPMQLLNDINRLEGIQNVEMKRA
jgi:hypothetical protein